MKYRLQKISWCGLLTFAIFPLAQHLLAQPAGLPISTRSHKELTISFDGGVSKRTFAGIGHTSPRFMLRALYGIKGRFDIFGQVGAAQLKLTLPSDHLVMEDRYRPAYGAGFNWHFFDFIGSGIRAFLGAQILRFETEPASEKRVTVGGKEVSQRTLLHYDWRELQAYFGFSKRFEDFSFYVGANVSVVSRLERRSQRLILNGEGVSLGEQRGKFNSGIISNPLIGFEIALPARTKLNFEGVVASKEEFALYVGLSQTGWP